MNQIISILDSYAYRTLVWDIYVERISRPASGGSSDVQRISAALPKAEVCLAALSKLIDVSPWLAGPAISLADFTRHQCSRFSDWLPRAPVFSPSSLSSGNGGIA